MGSSGGRTQTLVAMVAAAGIVQLPTAAIVVALPTIHGEFDASLAELQWTVTAFYIPFAAFLIVSGRLADTFGRRRALLTGAALFAGGSVIAAASPDAQVLIGGIAVAGIGGAMLMPSSMSLLTNVFTGARRGFAIGMWGAATELVSGAGVVIGGVLTGELSWRWIFVVNVAVAVLIVLLALRWTPESKDPQASRQVDLTGALLTVTGLTAITLALIQGATWGWGSPAIISLIVAGVLLLGAFAVVERRSPHPLVNPSFFKHRNFIGATTTIFVIDFSFGALLFFLPLYFQEILDYSPIETGVLLLPLTGLMVLASPLGGKIATRVGPRPPIVAGLALMVVAIYWISTLSLQTTYADLWAPTAIMGFGIGLALTPMNLAAMNAVSRDHAGAAAGLLVTLSGLGATMGVAVTGALFQEEETQRTVELVREQGVEVGRDAAQELDGVLAGAPGAQSALDRIAGGDTKAVEEAVREAFVSALGTSLKLSAALVLLGVLLAVALLRKSRPADAAMVDHPVSSVTPRPAPRGSGPLSDQAASAPS
jgi:EmrB/QacA subfamily drug resistance transporter